MAELEEQCIDGVIGPMRGRPLRTRGALHRLYKGAQVNQQGTEIKPDGSWQMYAGSARHHRICERCEMSHVTMARYAPGQSPREQQGERQRQGQLEEQPQHQEIDINDVG